ncbi:Uncharacterised protein [Leclercia adecarboxylata]|uniref:Uncharacterized protein n=1 Tax=Leclercia adecarboxylata TaxID=83655 RepID=A0A4U9HPR3_9ENTR|nr:Uncharacterised protein [Leclercia adecarboxylata]
MVTTKLNNKTINRILTSSFLSIGKKYNLVIMLLIYVTGLLWIQQIH